MTQPQFKVTGDDKIIRQSDGFEIPIDVNTPGFCDFATWAAANTSQVPDEFRYPKGSEFYCSATKAQLIDTLRTEGCMLFVMPPILDADIPIKLKSGPMFLVGGDQFWLLNRASASPSDAEPLASNGIYPEPTTLWVSRQLEHELNSELHDESSDIRCLSSWPVDRTFVYIDISDFSNYRAAQQALVINGLNTVSTNVKYWKSKTETRAFKAIRDRLCIGDGYIFVFDDEVLATFFAARLAVIIEHHGAKDMLPVEFHFRIGIHAGPVYRFWDTGRQRWNFIGDGINGGARVLQAIGKDYDDLIFLSDAVRAAIRTSTSKPNLIHKGLMKAMRPRGRRADKHGNHWRLFELTHDLIEK